MLVEWASTGLTYFTKGSESTLDFEPFLSDARSQGEVAASVAGRMGQVEGEVEDLAEVDWESEVEGVWGEEEGRRREVVAEEEEGGVGMEEGGRGREVVEEEEEGRGREAGEEEEGRGRAVVEEEEEGEGWMTRMVK